MIIRSNKLKYIKYTKYIDIGEGDDFDHPIYEDLRNLLDEEESDLFGFTDDENILTDLSDHKFDNFIKILKKYGFEFDVIDVTDMTLNGDILDIYPEIKSLFPEEIIDEFRLSNTSIDDVLDKISTKGMDSLDEIDKTILENL